MQPNPQNSVDTDALNLTHAIALSESDKEGQPNYNAVGKSGEKGAYQWMPGNYESAAKKFGFDPNDFSPATQDKVAYAQVKEYKDKGYQPHEIASLWNSGSPHNYQDHEGVNDKGVSYDTPSYVQKVKDNYQRILGVSSPEYNPTPYSQPAGGAPIDFSGIPTDTTEKKSPDSLGSELVSRGQDLSAATKSIVGGESTGNSRLSGLIQAGGAIAGGLNDVVGKAVELIPGVKQVEDLIGQGVGTLAKTPAGQSVVKSITSFSQSHPELAKDIGAEFNILTAIPIFKGLGVVGKIGMDAGSQALKEVAEKSFLNGAPELIASTKTGANFISKNPNVVKDMLDRRLIGDIRDGKYITEDALKNSSRTVGELNSKVGTILKNPQYATVSQDGETIAKRAIDGFTDRNGRVIEGMAGSGMTPAELIANAKKLDPLNKLLWEKFEAGQANLDEINKLRSSLDKRVKKVFIGKMGLDAPDAAISKELGANLSSSMRDAVQTIAPETQPLFKEMATHFDIQRALELMNGKKVVPGNLAEVTGHVVGTGIGAGVGGLFGGGVGALAGGLVGDKTAGTIAGKLAGKNITQGILKRTGTNAVRTSGKTALKGAVGLIGGATASKANR